MKYLVFASSLALSHLAFASTSYKKLQCHISSNDQLYVEIRIDKLKQDYTLSAQQTKKGKRSQLAPETFQVSEVRGEQSFEGKNFSLVIDLKNGEIQEREVIAYDEFGANLVNKNVYVFPGTLKTQSIDEKVECLQLK